MGRGDKSSCQLLLKFKDIAIAMSQVNGNIFDNRVCTQNITLHPFIMFLVCLIIVSYVE